MQPILTPDEITAFKALGIFIAIVFVFVLRHHVKSNRVHYDN
jgi:hypothetical protein